MLMRRELEEQILVRKENKKSERLNDIHQFKEKIKAEEAKRKDDESKRALKMAKY